VVVSDSGVMKCMERMSWNSVGMISSSVILVASLISFHRLAHEMMLRCKRKQNRRF